MSAVKLNRATQYNCISYQNVQKQYQLNFTDAVFVKAAME